MECRVGLPTDGVKRWRCDICSLLNVYSNDECQRCMEPMTDDRKQELLLKPKRMAGDTPKIVKRTSPSAAGLSHSSDTRGPNGRVKKLTGTQRRGIFNARADRPTAKRSQSSGGSRGMPEPELVVKKKPEIKQPIRELDRQAPRGRAGMKPMTRTVRATGSQQRRKSDTGPARAVAFGTGGKLKRVSMTRDSDSDSSRVKKLRKPDLSERHLGYKSNKSNIRTQTRSRLNQDTAAYRAKFADKQSGLDGPKTRISGMRKGMKVATVNDLTKNGWSTSIDAGKGPGPRRVKRRASTDSGSKAYPSKRSNIHSYQTEEQKRLVKRMDDRPVTPPGKGKKGSNNKRSLIDMLQKECSGEIMANMRAGGRYMRKQHVSMEGGQSRYAM